MRRERGDSIPQLQVLALCQADLRHYALAGVGADTFRSKLARGAVLGSSVGGRCVLCLL